MDINEIKIPTSKEDMAELRKTLRQEIADDDLNMVAGGNDDIKGKSTTIWTCPFCGAAVQCRQMQDAAKHMTKCPNNPYK